MEIYIFPVQLTTSRIIGSSMLYVAPDIRLVSNLLRYRYRSIYVMTAQTIVR